MERITTADCVGLAAFRDVIDFPNRASRNIPIFREAGWNESDVSPPVWPMGRNSHLFGFQHQIRFADRPLLRVIEIESRRHVGRITPRRAAVHPLPDFGNLLVGQRWIALELLNADVFLNEPRRHNAGMGAETGPHLDLAS